MKRHVCECCGKTVETPDDQLPPDWRRLDYDVDKYTPEVETAVVCSPECEMRLAAKSAAGGFK